MRNFKFALVAGMLFFAQPAAAKFACTSYLPGSDLRWDRVIGTDAVTCVAYAKQSNEAFRATLTPYAAQPMGKVRLERGVIGGRSIFWSVDPNPKEAFPWRAVLSISGQDHVPMKLVVSIPRLAPKELEASKRLLAGLHIPIGADLH